MAFPNTKKMKKCIESLDSNPMDCRKNPMTMELWRYYILPYCDLISLMQLNWTCAHLRELLNKPEFVVEWQSQCWYLYRECPCERNLFYLQGVEFCDFAFDSSRVYRGYYEVSAELRRHGRSVGMHQMDSQMNWQHIPRLEPTMDPNRFHPGLFQCWIENLIIPVPRMVKVGVEYTYVRSASSSQRYDNETTEEFQRRQFWRNFHSVEDNVATPARIKKADWIPFNPFDGELVNEDMFQYQDKVDNYIRRCQKEERDPLDPLDDHDDEGHEAAQWARKIMYGSPLGNQKYPMELCIREIDLMPNEAQRNGVDYIERLFLPLHKYHPSSTLMEHHGVVYFAGVRYENERGDFVNWAMATLSLQTAFYTHMWMDCCQHFLFTLATYLRHIATEIQDDLPPRALRRRWLELAHMSHCGDCQRNMDPEPHQRNRDREAIDQIVNNARYQVFNRLVMGRVTRVVEAQMERDVLDFDSGEGRRYMEQLIPVNIQHNPQRTEDTMVLEIDQALEVLSYMTSFALYVGARTDATTETTRIRTMQIYLCSGFSLLAFAPRWKKDYYDIFKNPMNPSLKMPMRVPEIPITKNHRYQRYLRFLNGRILYYQQDNEYMQKTAKHEDIDLGRLMEM